MLAVQFQVGRSYGVVLYIDAYFLQMFYERFGELSPMLIEFDPVKP